MKEFYIVNRSSDEDGHVFEVHCFDSETRSARRLETVTSNNRDTARNKALARRDALARAAGNAELTTPSLAFQQWIDAGGRPGATEVMAST